MADDEDEILAAELGKLGAKGGRLGAAAAGALGGATFAGRRLRKNVHEIELTLAAPSDEIFVKVVSLIGSTGQVVARTGPTDGKAIVRGIVGAGTMNLNPAVVTVTMTSASGGGTSTRAQR